MRNLWVHLLWVGMVAVVLAGCGKSTPEYATPYEADLAEAVSLLEHGQAEKALGLLTNVVTHMPTNAVVQLNLGVAYEQNGQMPEAVDAYREAAALAPRDARPLELAARLHMQVEDWDGARRLLDQANRREAYSPRILTTMGVVEYRAHNLGVAEAFFKAAIDADPDYASAYYNAAVLQRDGYRDMAHAVTLFESFLEHADATDAHRDDARAFIKAQASAAEAASEPQPEPEAKPQPQPEPEPAVTPEPEPEPEPEAEAEPEPAASEEKQTVSESPQPESQPDEADDPSGDEVVDSPAKRLWTRGLAAHRQNDLDRAIALYKAALESDPKLFGAWHNLGLAANSAGDLEMAREAFEKALTLRPEWPDTLLMLAVVLHKRGEDERAAALLDQLLAKEQRHVRANYLLAVIYANAGRRSMARVHFEHVLRLDGTGEYGSQARAWLKANERKSPPMPAR